MRNDFRLVSAIEQQFDRFPTPFSEIERPVVDVHPDELVRLTAIEITPELQGIRQCFSPIVECILNALFEQYRDLFHRLSSEIAANGVSTERQRQSGILHPPLSQIHDQMQSVILVRQLPFVNNQPRIDFAFPCHGKNLIKRIKNRSEIVAQRQFQCKIRRRQLAWNCDPFAAKVVQTARLTRDDHWSVVVTHAASAGAKSVFVGHIGIAVQTDGRQFQFATKRPVVERLNILKLMCKPVRTGLNLVVGERVKHERIVGIRAVANANKSLFGHRSSSGLRA